MTRRRQLLALFAVSASLGMALLAGAFPAAPPQPVGAGAVTGVAPTVTPLARSQPVRVTVARVGIDARIDPVGAKPDGTPETPPLDAPDRAGWYRSGASPGEVGNAVLLGHVDTRAGPAVFYALGALVPGDQISVTRQDHTIARFVVERVESHPKTEFPTDLVFGPATTANLRLVTCGGVFDASKRSYVDNVVVTASLTSAAAG